MMLQLHQRGAYVIAECPCGQFGRIVGAGDEEPIAAIIIAVNLGDLIDHVRECRAGMSATDQLVDKLMRERYGLEPRSVTR
jgi:hypothetical protein